MKSCAASWGARALGNLVAMLVCAAAHQVSLADETPPETPKAKQFFVIAPNAFHPALADYVEYKRSLRPTTLVSLEHVLQSTTGVDDPERLKRFLYNAWRKEAG
jgi:hypothetical protein